MTNTNEVSVSITEQDMQSMLDAIAVLQSRLPFLITLSTDDRKELPKMGDKTFAFVNKSLEYVENNPTTVPPYLDVPELHKDVMAVKDLMRVLNPLKQLCESLDDTIMQAGSEAYVASLAYYSYIKSASKAGQLGAKTIVDDLQERFPGRTRKSASVAK